MAAPAAPAAGAGIEAIAGLLLIVGFLVLLGLQQAWRASIGWLLLKLADLFDSVSVFGSHPLGFVADALRAASHNVWVALGHGALALERSGVWLFSEAARQLRWVGRELEGLANDTRQALAHLLAVDVPRVAHAAALPAIQAVHGIDRLAGRIKAQEKARLARLAHGIDRIVARALHEVHAATNAAIARVGITSRQLRRMSRRMSRVEKLTVGAGAAALVATALGRLGLRWLRCPALGRIGRKIGCGGFGWLEGFFASTFEALVVLDLCKFALAAQQLARLIVPNLAGMLLVQNAVCLGGGASLPSAHDTPKILKTVTLPSAHD